MHRSRVILANEPRLLRGMLRRAIARAPGLQVVGETSDLDDLPALVRKSGSHWAIVSLWPPGLPPFAIRALLLEQPALSVLGVAADGSQARIARLTWQEETREGLSLADLLSILQQKEVKEPDHSTIEIR